MGVTTQHTGGGCLRPLRLSGGTGELNTKHTFICIVRLVYSMEVVCKSDDFYQEKNRKGAQLENSLLIPTVVIGEYTPPPV